MGLGFRVGGRSDNIYLSHEGSALFQDDMLIYLHGNGFVVMTSGGGGAGFREGWKAGAESVTGFPVFFREGVPPFRNRRGFSPDIRAPINS